MKQFLLDNWRLILEACLVITSAIIFAIRKKPVKVVDTLKECIVRLLPGCINEAEMSDAKGKDKKALCTSLLHDALKELGYCDDVLAQYTRFISDQVEVILSTPQKKGINYENKK